MKRNEITTTVGQAATALAGMSAVTATTAATVGLGWIPWFDLLEQVLAQLLVVAGVGTAVAVWRVLRSPRPRIPRSTEPARRAVDDR